MLAKQYFRPSILCALTALVGLPAAGAPGDLDLTFGGTGKVTTYISGANDTAWDMALQSDSKIVVVGHSGLEDFAVVRYNVNGSLDTTFNGTGKAYTDFGGSGDVARGVAFQVDGKIVVAGQSSSDFAIARFNANGSLDTSFNGTGKVTTDFAGSSDIGRELALQSDGKIIVVGEATLGGNLVIAVARYNANGSLDTTFNSTGKLTTSFGGTDEAANCVVVQSDGKIVVAGRSSAGPDLDFSILRYNSDGSLDTTFNGTGKASTDLGNNDNANGLVVQGDGKFVVVGSSATPSGIYEFAIARYNAEGSLDGTFNGNGKVTTAIGIGGSYAGDVAIQSDGKLVVTGTSSISGGDSSFAVCRYNSDGSLDTTLNGTGKVTTEFGSTLESAFAVALQSDGKIVAAGETNVSGGFDVALVRYQGNAPWDLDASFNPVADGDVSSSAEQPDGKTIIGGGFTMIDGVARNYVARLNADGSLDNGFNPDADYTVSSIAVQGDGKVVIGGAFNTVGGIARNYLARVDGNGVVDPGFNPAPDNVVSSILRLPDGRMVIGGSFTTVGGVTRNRVARLLANGTLDAGFNPDVNGDVLGMAQQADGRFLVCGNFSSIGGVTRNGIARLNADGTLDTGFNPNANLDVLSVVVQADGKVVIGGAFTTVGGTSRSHCARLNPDGSLDTTFNPNANGNVTSIVLRADGKLMLGGSFTTIGGLPRPGVAALKSDGSVFDGFAPVPNDALSSVMVQADGDVLLGGYFTTVDGVSRPHLALVTAYGATQNLTVPDLTRVQWLRDGSTPEVAGVLFELSTNSGANWSPLGGATRIAGGWELTGLNLPLSGQVRARGRTAGGQANGSSGLVESLATFSFANVNAEVVSAALQADGKMLIGGSFTSAGATARNRIARFNPNGTLDTNFNPDANNTVMSSAVQNDGRILIGGSFTTVGGLTRNSIARLNADGTVEAAFSPNVNAEVNSIGLQTDGKIVIGGSFTSVGGSTRNRCARLNATGTLDTGFNPNVNGAVNSVAIQPDGKILIGGAFTAVGTARNGIARLNSTGSLETTFNPNVTGGTVSCIALQADGKILLAGSFTSVGGTARNRIARINADGSLDTTFNPSADNAITSMVVQVDGKILIGGSFTTLGATSRSRLARLLADGSVDSTFSADADNSVSCLALKADGNLLAGGLFTAMAGSSISYLALVDNDDATQNLTVPDYSRVQWLRGGSSPETQHVTFELSTDGGTVWTALGTGTRISGGWEKTGLDLSGSGLVRARARTRGGQFGGSSGLVETVTSYTGFVPEIAVEQPTGTNVADGGSKNFGNVVLGEQVSISLSVRNEGSYPLTGLGISIDGTHSGDFTVLSPPAPPLAPGASATFSVRFTPGALGARAAALHLTSNDPDENPFEISLNGMGVIAGSPDRGFVSGIDANQPVYAVALQPDGKILLAGEFTSIGGQVRNRIARLNKDGSLDVNFNPNCNGTVYSLAVQRDGKILIGGFFTTVGGQPRSFIARLNADGTVEGTTTFNPGTGPNNNVVSIVVQPDGKILVAGDFTMFNGQVRNQFARLNANGSLESSATFNPESGANGRVNVLALQADGRILIGGNFTTVGGEQRNGIARLSSDGTLESASTFNPGSGANASVTSLLVRPDGRILVAGFFTVFAGQTRERIALLREDGSLANSLEFGASANRQIWSMALQADGKILIAGHFNSVNAQPRTYLARLYPNGELEDSSTFSLGSGISDSGDQGLYGALLGADGSILIVGDFDSVDGIAFRNIARLVNDPAGETLEVLDSARMKWWRGLGAGEVTATRFELSVDGGGTWTLLGSGTRIAGGWELEGLNLPPQGTVRASGRTSGGFTNASSGLVEQVTPFTVTPNPDIAVEQPAGVNIQDGGSVAFGSAVVANSTSRTFTIKNPGYGSLTGLAITIDGTNSSEFTVTTSPTAPVASGGGSTTFTVKFTPSALGARTAALHIASNDPDENPFDITLTGIGMAAGFVDPAFDPNVSGTWVSPAAVQPDGKIVIGGIFTSVGGQPRSNLARLNADGTLEDTSTFNPGTGANALINGVALQADGKILIVGGFSTVNGQPRNCIARLHANGVLEDTTTFNIGTGANSVVNCVVVQPDGKIVIAGSFTSVNGQPRSGIARLNPNGEVEDTATFNIGSGSNGSVYALALQPDGKILIGGYFTSVNGQARNIARLLPNGTLEDAATFTPPYVYQQDVNAILVQPDGKILIGGYFTSVSSQPRNGIARLNADGSVESTATFNPGTGANEDVFGLALQADGKILVAGRFTGFDGQSRWGLARLQPNGALEDTATFHIGNGSDNAIHGVTIAPDGAILITGQFQGMDTFLRNRIARLMNGPATQTLSIPNSTRIQWSRGGTAPEVGQVTFELSTNGGSNWTSLGNGSRIAGGWELIGLNLPATGSIRARGRTNGGVYSSSSGIVEQIAPFSVSPNPDIAVEQPAGANIPDGGSRDFGSRGVGTSSGLTFTIKNPGYASLTGLGITIDGTNSSEFTVTTSPAAAVASGGGSTTFTVQFTPEGSDTRSAALHIASNDPDENPFDISLTGTGVPQGAVDLAFNPNVSGTDPLAQAIAVQPDGKILVGGRFSTLGGVPRNNICRLQQAGAVESTATFTPVAVTDATTSGQIESIAVQADGKILIGGYFTAVDGQSRTRIARLNPNGSVESLATFNPGTGANNWVRCVAVQPDGKILVSGNFTTINGHARNGIARLNQDGTVESASSFNPGTGATGGADGVFVVAPQADGKILLGGTFTSFDGQARSGIARLNSNGSLENLATFNSGTGVAGGTYGVFCVAVQPDGKIVVGGDFTNINGVARNNIARLNADGSVESIATFNPGTGANGYVRSIVLQADGKILIGGSFTTVNGLARNRIARLNADGSLEDAAVFDVGSGPNGYVAGLAVEPDGDILVGGAFTSVSGQTRNNISRLTGGSVVQTLSAPDSGRVLWMRGGAAPEVEQVTFESSRDGGTSWSQLGSGARIAGGWERTALSLPPTGIIRARGRTSGGSINASSGLVEQLQSFAVTPTPEIAVEQPAGIEIVGGSTYSFGGVNVGSNASRTFTIRNKGYADLIGIAVVIDGPDAPMYSVTAGPATSVSGPAGFSTFTVRFDHFSSGVKTATLRIASNDADESPFNITLTGRDPTTNTDLSSLLLSEGTLAPAFSSSTTSYTASVPYGTATVRVTPSAADPNAAVSVNGRLVPSGVASNPINLNIGVNLITTLVVAEDGIASKTYVTTVNRVGPVPGAVNPAFGDPNVVGSYVTATAVQPDGKILIGGLFTNAGGQAVGSLCRLNTDGSVESPATFNTGTGANGQVACIIVQADGKIIIIGEFTSVNGQPRNYLARLNSDGTLESAATFNPGSGPNDAVKCGMLQSDGKILIGGHFTTVNGQTRNHIARLNADGSLESSASFNPGAGANGNVYGMATQPDGKIVIGGQFTSFDGQARSHVARLLPNGSLESTATFNPGTGADHWIFSIAVQADDRILIGGSFTAVNGQARNRIARLNIDGSLESPATFNPGTGVNGTVYSLIPQTDGRILMGGPFTIVDGQARNGIARLLADGTVENATTFNIGTGANDIVLGVTMQADGGILLGGYFTSFNGAVRNRVAQLVNGAVFENLSIPDASRVQWNRSGAGPEVEQVTFELSNDGGTNWIPLGSGTRIPGGWERTALSLPATGALRARGRTRGGDLNCSSGIIERVQSFSNKPVVMTNPATGLAISGATMNASVTPNGPATLFFEYGPTSNYGSTTPVQNVTGGAALNVQAIVTGLAANSPHHYRAVATNAAGTVYGEDILFSTLPDPPNAVTANALAITSSSATLVGAVNPRNRATQVYFEYGSTTLYGNSTPVQNLAIGNSVVEITAPVTGLSSNATYHYRVVATNSGGTAYGSNVSFQASSGGTPTAAPSVSSGGTTDITTTAATLQGTVNPNGGITNAYFEYGIAPGFGSTTTNFGAGSGTTPQNISAAISSLQSGTQYQYRLIAVNSLGTTQGSILTFTTNFLPPTATTNGSAAISTTSVRVNGTVRARNASTQVFFDYGTDGVNFPNSASATPSLVTGDMDTAVSADLPNLLQGTTYYYRVRAVSVGGTGTGLTSSFQVAILSGLLQQFPAAPPSASGSVTVTLTPSGVASGWRFYGERQWRTSGSTASAMTTGDREIEFRPVPGYIQPPRESVSAISGGAGISLERDYYETETTGSGAISVTLKPDSIAAGSVAVADRAQWRFLGDDNTQWRDSGTAASGLPPGTYLVECKPVAGRTTPPTASVPVANDQTSAPTITYFLADALTGTPPAVLPFSTVSTDTTKPYAYVGQIRSNVGSSSGFVVKPRVVATAGHVVFDDGTLSAVSDLQWLFQRDAGTYEPKPQVPRGFYIFDGYAAQRTADNSPGSSSPQSQTLDVASLYFVEDAGRSGYGGFLASDLTNNEFLLSSSQKTLVGYPVDGIPAIDQGRMHATNPANVLFASAYGRTFTTTGIRSSGGMSGGPLCIQHSNGNFYPAAIYLGGTNQTVVRAIDSGVIDLFNRAEVSGNGGSNNTGGGITHSSFSSIGTPSQPGALEVTIQPAAARSAGAGWRLKPEIIYRPSGNQKGGLNAGTYVLQLSTVSGFQAPTPQSVTVNGGQLREITFTYVESSNAPTISNVANQTIAKDANTGALAITLNDADDPETSLVLSGTSSNTTLVPDANILFGGSGANRTVTVTPASGQLGMTTITLTVSDGALTANRSFMLTITGTAQETWRFSQFGSANNAGPAADTADPDGDGSLNLDEYAAGTDPNNASDVFRILSTTKTGGGFTATAAGKASRSYVLERRGDLDSGPWTPVSSIGPLAADGPVNLTDPAPPVGSAFYRMRVSAP